jgi:glutathione S-transferase
MADRNAAPPPILLTFAPMVDSECSRLLLRYYRLGYREKDHLFGWVSVLTLFHGGYGRVPLLYRRGLRVTSPRAIAERLDADLPPERRLIPATGPLAAEVEAHWETYNGVMGADAAVFAYYHLLPARELMQPIFAAPVPPFEKKLLPVIYPLLRGLFTLLLRLNAKRADEALARIRATFDKTDALIADGRRYLAGDRLTLADLSLASASAPLLLPPGYGAKMPAPEEMPEPVRAAVRELRAHPTGAFVKRLYAEGFVSPA